MDETFESSFLGNAQSDNKKSFNYSPAAPVKCLLRWPTIKPWFVAHNIGKLDDQYVVTVRYALVMRVFVTGTSKGEVKIWGSDAECTKLGSINSPYSDPW